MIPYGGGDVDGHSDDGGLSLSLYIDRSMTGWMDSSCICNLMPGRGNVCMHSNA